MDTELVTTTLISTDIDTETHTLAIKCDEIELKY